MGLPGMSHIVSLPTPQSLLFIPSHCTTGHHGTTRDVPYSPTPYPSIPTVHPIPLYHWTSWDYLGCPIQSHSLPLNPYCPSDPTVPLDTMGLPGMSHTVPLPTPQSLLSIPSHCTTGHHGTTWDVPYSPTPYPSIPTVHPIPLYHWTPWDYLGCPIQSHSLPLNPYCPSHPTVPLDTMGLPGMSHTVPLPTPQSLLSIPSHCTTGHHGTTWDVPYSPTPYPSIPIVHPIPLYHWTPWDYLGCPIQSHSLPLNPYCPFAAYNCGQEYNAT